MTPFPIILIIAIAGVLNGLREASHKNPDVFQESFGWSSDGWFGRNSWMLKYKDYPNNKKARFIGAKTFMAWVTDYWHFSNAMLVSLLVFAPLINGYTLKVAIVARVIYSLASHLIYTWVNRRAAKNGLPF